MTLLRFEAVTGHAASQAPIGNLFSVQTMCNCDGELTQYYATGRSVKEATKILHQKIYRHHCQIVFLQQKWRCAHCGRRLPLDPHHKVRRSKGRVDTVENLQGLCRPCHDRETNRVRPAGGGAE